MVFDAGAAQANVFVGGTDGSTINAGAGGGSFFSTAGELYNFGTSATQTFVGLGGSDTLSGTQGSVAPVVFALGSTGLTISAPSPPVTVVSSATAGTVDASRTAGGDDFFIGYGAGGNESLTSSATGPETFVVGANPTAMGNSISIWAWHPGDVFYLTGFTAADTATMDAAIVVKDESHGPGDLEFKLSDNTSVTFLVSHPDHFDGAGAAY